MYQKLTKPPGLQRGDKVAAVSLSWGAAGEPGILWRYRTGKERLETVFGLNVVEMPHTLKGTDYVYKHPKERAEDLMEAFSDPSIKGIISCVGGEDTVRLLPYIDFEVIRRNPKVFMGYSDTTVNHFMCWKAGVSSIYGPALLSDFAENVAMRPYTVDSVNRTLFSGEPLGAIAQADEWTSEYLEWTVENKDTARRFFANNGYRLVQGEGAARGHLIGGCVEVLDWLRGTELFPPLEDFQGAILFLETSEDRPDPHNYRYMLRCLGAMGVLNAVSGIILGKPYKEIHMEEYDAQVQKVLAECGRLELPVLGNLSFGHCEPKCALPYGALAEIDCSKKRFSILESAVTIGS